MSAAERFGSIVEVEDALRAQSYLPERGLATALFLSLAIKKPLLLEGEAASARRSRPRRWRARWAPG